MIWNEGSPEDRKRIARAYRGYLRAPQGVRAEDAEEALLVLLYLGGTEEIAKVLAEKARAEARKFGHDLIDNARVETRARAQRVVRLVDQVLESWRGVTPRYRTA
jgi:hypothetical protein